MTENKRFISKDESIINVATDELVNASSEDSAKILVDWLNEHSDKYAEQRKENYGLLDGIAFYKEENASLIGIIYDLECENEQLKQSLKEIDDAELHLKQIILKRIDDYIWEWEDEGTPVAQVLRELRDEIKGDVE